MFCKYCGAEIADDSIFCQKCGQKVSEDTPSEDTPSDNSPKEQTPANGQQQGGFVSFLALVAGIVCAIMGAMALLQGC